MQFRILGPLQVRDEDGQPLALEPRQARLLAALLLANEIVSRHHLIEAIWDDDPPATVARQLRNLVSALRRRLAEAGGAGPSIVVDGSGYRIRIDEAQLDAQVFARHLAQAQDLAAAGQAAEASRQLRMGLALWRGPALAGCTAGPTRAGAVRLDEQRLSAFEQCVDLELQLGRHHNLVGELTALVTAHPLRETLVGQLMLALHRCGRRADALAAYQQLRIRLADELGIDPTPSVQQVHTAILRSEPEAMGCAQPAGAAVATAPVPRQLPAPVRHFVGRIAEMKDLTRLTHETTDVVIAAICGTGGIGKTTLALHWAHQVADRFPDGQLHLNLRGFGPSGPPMPPAEAIRNLLDAFHVPPERIPGSLDAQAGLYRSLIAGRRMLVVLDNARDSDQVRPLLAGTPGCLVLVTSRSQLTDLRVADGAHAINLDLLTVAEAHDLLTRHLGPQRLAAETAAADQIITHGARLPLALSIVAARAAAHPSFPLADLAAELADTRQRLDTLDTGEHATQLRAVFSWSFRSIPPATARLFRLLGLHPGPDISAAAAASLAGIPLAQVRPLLAELSRASLITERMPSRYTCHDLLRAYAAELAGSHDSHDERQAAQQRILDHYLHTAYTAARMLHPLRQRFIPADPRPGVAPEALNTDQQALSWLSTEHQVLLAAVRLAADSGHDRHTCQLAWCLTDFLDWRGHWHDWATAQQAALHAAQRLTDPAAEVLAHRGMAGAHVRRGAYDAAYHHLSQALDLADRHTGPADQAQVRINLATVCARTGRYEETLTHAERALHLARLGNDRAGEGIALHTIGWAHALRGQYRQALTYGRQALTVVTQLGDREGEAATWDSLGEAYHHLGDHAQAITCFQRSLHLCRALKNRYYEASGLVHLGEAHQSAGNFAAADHAWRSAHRIFEELGHLEAEQVRKKLSRPDTHQ